MSTVKRNLSDLPAAPQREGVPPNPNPKFVTQLAEAWYAEVLAGGVDLDRAIPEAGPYRASLAGTRCDRALFYALRAALNPRPLPPLDEDFDPEGFHFSEAVEEWDLAFGESDPPGIADQWRFAIGHMVHAGIQQVMDRVNGGRVLIEQAVDLNPAGIPGSAHADLIVLDESGAEVCVVEYKTINGFGFKMAATTFKGAPEGPRSGHALQAAMVAVARGVPFFAVGYFSLENLSPSMAKDFANGEIGRFTAEWRFRTEDWVPQVNAEAARIARVLADVEAGRLSPRVLDDDEFPRGATVVEPERDGRWEAVTEDGVLIGSGTTWHCAYCPNRSRCIADGES